MNKSTENLTFEQRFDLQVSESAVEIHFQQLKFPRISAEFLDTSKIKDETE